MPSVKKAACLASRPCLICGASLDQDEICSVSPIHTNFRRRQIWIKGNGAAVETTTGTGAPD